MPRTQSGRILAVSTDLGADKLLIKHMSGTESLGRMFSYTLELTSEDKEISFEALIGKPISVRLELLDGSTRYFNGFVSRFVQTAVGTRLAHYRATVVPWLWFLTRVADCRIFQNKTVPDIIKEVFRSRGFSNFDDTGLTGPHRTWEYCVQYRETDFNFVSRLMEQEGIYYYFKHENGKHTLMLADSSSAHPQLPGYPQLLYRPPSKARFEYETISDWVLEKEVQPGVYALTDYDFVNPKKALEAKAAISRKHAVPDLEVFDYPGEYNQPADGDTYARIRIEELQAQYEVATAQTDARGLTPGFRLKMAEHPRGDQNREYLITSATYDISSDEFESSGKSGGTNGSVNAKAKFSIGSHRGGSTAPTPSEPPPEEEPQYRCTFTAIDAQSPFRPARITPRPLIQGPQTATVVGKQGEEIWTDEHGRVKVRFHWDRYSDDFDKCSCWIRVAQLWAGKKWGAIYTPRIGQEVVVEFLEGDPDKPLVTGRVYNGDAKPPYTLPAMATISTIKSYSSKGGGGFNEVRFEDKKGEEQLFIHAEKQMDVRVKANSHETVLAEKHLVVGTKLLEHVKESRNEVIDGDHLITIGGKRSTKLTGDEIFETEGKVSIKATGDVAISYGGAQAQEVTGALSLTADSIVIEGKNGVTIKCGSSAVVIDSSGVTITGSTIVLDGSSVKIASGPGSSPASGSAPSTADLVAPAAAAEAATADPGQNTEPGSKTKGDSPVTPGTTPVGPVTPGGGGGGGSEQPVKVPIEFKLVDAADQPVANEDYKLYVTGEDAPRTGKTKSDGTLRVENLDPGSYDIQFPNRYDAEWVKVETVAIT